MPELPEVETTRRGIAPRLVGGRITTLRLRERRLRWPVPPSLPGRLAGQPVTGLARRGKYLLMETGAGTALLHLGMSGSLRFVAPGTPPAAHDHYDLELEDGGILRFNDPRRFGALLWAGRDAHRHRLLASLGPEPLGEQFSADYLYRVSRGRRVAIKQLLMNANIVVGVGNIYASESLFRAGINPRRAAGRISKSRIALLVDAVRAVLADAIREGGTTLRDFSDGDGRPGYFAQHLAVYGRAGEPCPACGEPVRQIAQGQRSTFYCVGCQR